MGCGVVGGDVVLGDVVGAVTFGVAVVLGVVVVAGATVDVGKAVVDGVGAPVGPLVHCDEIHAHVELEGQLVDVSGPEPVPV